MKRILLVTDIFPPDIGGPASFMDRLGHSLVGKGYRVSVVCMSDRGRDESDARRPFRVRRVRRGNTLVSGPILRLVLTAEMLRHSRILVNNLEHAAFHAALVTRRRYVLKIVSDTIWEIARNLGLTDVTEREFQGRQLSTPLLRDLADRRRRYLSRASLIISPSEHIRSLVMGWEVAAVRVATIPNGVPLEKWAREKPRQRTTGPLEILFVGRLTNWKGVENLLLAVSRLDSVRLTIVGDGPEMPILKELARLLGLDGKAFFRGRLKETEVQEAMSLAHVLVLASVTEGLSHTLLEASATGLPAIASDCGGNPEVITHEINGLLVPYGRLDELIGSLQRLRDDEPFRYRLACAARENSLRFDFRQTVEQFARILGE